MPTLKELYTNQFDFNTLKQYAEDGNYQGMIDELETVYSKLDDYDQRNRLSVKIGQLKTELNKETALLNNKTDDEVDAYYFNKALETGIAPKPINNRSNHYWDDYTKYINNLGGENATNLKFQFYNSDAYNEFLSNLGYNTNDLKNAGVEVNYDGDGKPYVKLSKADTKNMAKILPAINKLDDDRRSGGLTNTVLDKFIDPLVNPYTRTIRRLKESEGFFDFLGRAGLSLLNQATGGTYDRLAPTARVKLYGYDDDNNIVDDYDKTSDGIASIVKSRGREYHNNLFGTESAEWYKSQSFPGAGRVFGLSKEIQLLQGDALGDGLMFIKNAADYQVNKIKAMEDVGGYSLSVLPFLSGNEARIMSYKDKNLMSDEAYKNWITTEKTNFDNALVHEHLSQYDVFTSDENGLIVPVNPEDKNNLDRLLKEAINSNRTNYKAAMVGPDMGVAIQILEKSDKGELENDINSPNHGRTIFVKGLWKEYTEEAFGSRPEFKAAKEVAQMTSWGYTYELSNGYRIENPTPNGAIYVSAKNPNDKMLITQADMQRLINEDYAKQDAAAEIGLQYEKQIKKRGMSMQNADNNIDVLTANVATQIAKESIPNTHSKEYYVKVREIYNELLNKIGYSGNRTLRFEGID